jgi:hypothetical protein
MFEELVRATSNHQSGAFARDSTFYTAPPRTIAWPHAAVWACLVEPPRKWRAYTPADQLLLESAYAAPPPVAAPALEVLPASASSSAAGAAAAAASSSGTGGSRARRRRGASGKDGELQTSSSPASESVSASSTAPTSSNASGEDEEPEESASAEGSNGEGQALSSSAGLRRERRAALAAPPPRPPSSSAATSSAAVSPSLGATTTTASPPPPPPPARTVELRVFGNVFTVNVDLMTQSGASGVQRRVMRLDAQDASPIAFVTDEQQLFDMSAQFGGFACPVSQAVDRQLARLINKPRFMLPDAVRALPTMTAREGLASGAITLGDQCGVCLQPLALANDTVLTMLLPCQHKLHQACAIEALGHLSWNCCICNCGVDAA